MYSPVFLLNNDYIILHFFNLRTVSKTSFSNILHVIDTIVCGYDDK